MRPDAEGKRLVEWQHAAIMLDASIIGVLAALVITAYATVVFYPPWKEILVFFGMLAAVSALLLIYFGMRDFHGTSNPRHWLTTCGSTRVELASDFYKDRRGKGWSTEETYASEIKWCRRHCRGRWKLQFDGIYFARKRDAAKFRLLQGAMD